jgi:hypothetical protein
MTKRKEKQDDRVKLTENGLLSEVLDLKTLRRFLERTLETIELGKV